MNLKTAWTLVSCKMSSVIVQLVLRQNLGRLLSPMFPYCGPSILFYFFHQLQTNPLTGINKPIDVALIGPQSVNPFPVAYFVILEFDSQPQINRHQQARCRTYLVLVLLKIRLRWVFRLILICRRSQPINKASGLLPNQKARLLNLKTSLSILWILFLRMKFQLHLNRF